MTKKQFKNIRVQLRLISEYFCNISVDVDDLENDDITMTEENKKKIIRGMYGDSYKLELAVKDLQKILLSEIPEWNEVEK